jgi:hypothetical protein
MKFEKKTPAQSLNQAYRKEHLETKEFEQFRIALEKLLEQMEKQREENTKNLMSDFLKDAYYKNLHAINASEHSDIDAVIHHQDTQKSPVGIIIENKKPNSSEFVSVDNLNKKSFQQLVFYYLKERIENKNTEVKRLIITDVYEWFIFDETEFDKVFYQNKGLVKKYTDFQRSKKSTKHFYEEIAQPFIADSEQEITYTHFDLREYENELESFKKNFDKKEEDEIDQITQQKEQQNEKKLIHLYKILSPVHLLKKPFANDSNSLNKDFYNELLHILGLEEVKEQNKKVIKRKNTKDRELGSFLENTLSKLERKRPERIENYKTYGQDDTERLENIALELCITWTNRILFLKLLEAQLLQYHKAEKKEIRQKYKFLNSETIRDFVTLDDLFFGVLAKRPKDRRDFLKDFAHIPYLNSSLFEETLLESSSVLISQLSDNAELTLYSKTILKYGNGIRRNGKETPLSYFFQFLDAYNFSSEGTEEIRKDKKTLINASVLGLIFEKINGYKDGSFYTPSFITMYMCRQTIRRAVIQKFSDEYKTEFKDFESLQQFLFEDRSKETRLKNNKIFDSLKICDPAVGSGHFLVSALNELLAIKEDLRILADSTGNRLPVNTKIENDELIILENEETIFDYKIKTSESQLVQKTLFHEKQKLIENCLFGVDINPNSVKICRLRLWIELLKNAYYTSESNYTELETLPNIDINIKTGNSLISRFDLDADISKALQKSKWSIDSYQIAVQTYRNATNREQKYEMEQLIDTIKADFRSEVSKKDPKLVLLSKKAAELQTLLTQTSVFELSKTEQKTKQKNIEKLEKEVLELNQEIEDIKSNKIYQNAFEWRFEFPEVLDNKGNFVGFDIIIANPPYMLLQTLKKEENIFLKQNFTTANYKGDTFGVFIEQAYQLSKKKASMAFIVPYTWLTIQQHADLRKLIINEGLTEIVNLPQKVFEKADLDTTIIQINKTYNLDDVLISKVENEIIFPSSKISKNYANQNDFNQISINLNSNEINILEKISKNSTDLQDFFEISQGYIPYDKYRGHDEHTIKNRIWHSNRKKNKTYKKELKGKDLQRYNFEWNGELWVSYGNWLAAPREQKFFTSPRILIMEVTRGNKYKITSAFVEEEYYNTPSIINVISKNNEVKHLKCLLGFLNSRLMTWIHLKKHSKALANTSIPKILVRETRGIPINEDLLNSEILEQKVESILSLKKANPKADTSELESEIDDLVYELYGLNEEEIKIING